MNFVRCIFSSALAVMLLAAGVFGAGPNYYEPTAGSGYGANTGTALFHACTDALNDQHGGIVYIPNDVGTINVSSTIDLQNFGPIIIEGAATGVVGGRDIFGWGGAQIKWTGSAGGTIFKVNSFGTIFRNLTIDGQGTAGIGIEQVNSPTPGSSNLLFERMNVRRCTTAGIQFGEDANTNNVSEGTFNQVYIDNCGSGVKFTTPQALNYVFNNCHIEDCTNGLYVSRGGAIVYTGDISNCDVAIKIGGGGNYNAGRIKVIGGHWEMAGHSANKYMTLVDGPSLHDGSIAGDAVLVDLDGVNMSPSASYPSVTDPGNHLFNIGGGVTVIARNCLFQRLGTGKLVNCQGFKSGSTVYRAIFRDEDSVWKIPELTNALCRPNDYGRVQISRPRTTTGKQMKDYAVGDN